MTAPDTRDKFWRRTPGHPFDSLKRERYAQARARGGTVKASGNDAGIGIQTAFKYEKHPEMKARIRELRSNAEDFLGVSLGWVVQELKTNVEAARRAEHFKSSNEALMLLHKIMTTDKNAAHNIARALPAEVNGQKLQDLLRANFNQTPSSGRRRRASLPETTNTPVIDTTAVDLDEAEVAE